MLQSNSDLNRAASAGEQSSCLETLDRHAAFWHRTPVQKPLLRVVERNSRPFHQQDPVFRDRRGATDGEVLAPGLLDHAANLERNRPGDTFQDDLIWGWAPFEVFWTEGALGCELVRASQTTWPRAFLNDWSDVDRFEWPGTSGWIDELVAITRLQVQLAGDAFPISHPLTHGPLDMLEAALNHELFYTGFYDEPERIERLLGICAEVFLQCVESRLNVLPPFRGGYLSRVEVGLWAPGPLVWFSADAMRNLSPPVYQRFLSKIDEQICARFPFSMLHIHSASLHMLPTLLKNPALTAIEITIDPAGFGPPPLTLIDSYQAVQRAGKSLMIAGPLRQAEAEEIMEQLSPVGLALRVELQD